MAAGTKRTMLLSGALLLAAGLLLVVSLQTVSPQERAFKVPRLGGVAVRLEPGTHFAPPFAYRLVRLPLGPARARGTVPVRWREGSSLVAGYEIEANLPDGALRRRLDQGGAHAADLPAALVEAATAALTEWSRTASGEEMALGSGRDAAEE